MYLRAGTIVLVLLPACWLGRDMTMTEPTTGESSIIPASEAGATADESEAGSPETQATPIESGVDASKSESKDAGEEAAAPPVRCADGKNDETEPNGLPLVGDQLRVGTFCGSIYRPNDIDVLKLDLGAQGRLAIEFHATADARIVLKGNGQTLEGGSGARHDLASSGPWTLTIQSPAGTLQNWYVVRE